MSFFVHRPGAPGVVIRDGIAYKADPTRGGKLLSVSRFPVTWRRAGATLGNVDLVAAAMGSHTNPAGDVWRVERDVTLVALVGHAVNVLTADCTLTLEENGGTDLASVVLSVATPSSNIADNLNVDRDAGDLLAAVQTTAGGTASNPMLTAIFAYRSS